MATAPEPDEPDSSIRLLIPAGDYSELKSLQERAQAENETVASTGRHSGGRS